MPTRAPSFFHLMDNQQAWLFLLNKIKLPHGLSVAVALFFALMDKEVSLAKRPWHGR
ncbi:hypothetical protein P4S91_10135 [Aneurinibacillus aneurinilyticus]|nr:hypothetical protein [Aneurinibacillus aneurinilyticus]MED0723273.1 hypothetical protein [Aneurinibacillus aneurinilyticus]MED0739795.1 hypothetical protein [Aneurinibacillus aneurinilyticus]